MYQALYRKYRPKSFDDVVGQEVIVKTLTKAVTNDMVSHSYLFTGPRGTGKTSIAKIFAKVLNCENLKAAKPCEKCASCNQIENNQIVDVIEIDAASNNGVDEVREIRNKIGLVPSNSKYKVYIVDEVHMLTNQAFNALLKTLEEPPEHIIFIFATTEPHKIPQTILSRCQRFDFKRIHPKHNAKRLEQIAKKEEIKISKEAIYEIARLSNGGLRDSIGMLDQVVSYADDEITVQDIHDINGTVNKSELWEIIENLVNKELSKILVHIDVMEEEGKSVEKILQEIIQELRNLIIYTNAPEMVEDETKVYAKLQKNIDTDEIYKYIYALSETVSIMKNSANNKILLEIELIKLMNTKEKEKEEKIKEFDEYVDAQITKEDKRIKELNKETVEAPKSEKQKKESSANTKLEELKKARINNALVSVSQKARKEFAEKLEMLKELLMDPEQSKIVSLIFDGELKAISGENIVFVYKTALLAEAFNLELIALQKIFKDNLKEDYKLIAVSLDEWNDIKEEYNKKKNSYVLVEETLDLTELYKKENEIKAKEANEIEDLFDDIIEYV